MSLTHEHPEPLHKGALPSTVKQADTGSWLLLNIGWMQCRITILRQMYIYCTFIIVSLVYKYEVIGNGNYTGIYTNV